MNIATQAVICVDSNCEEMFESYGSALTHQGWSVLRSIGLLYMLADRFPLVTSIEKIHFRNLNHWIKIFNCDVVTKEHSVRLSCCRTHPCVTPLRSWYHIFDLSMLWSGGLNYIHLPRMQADNAGTIMVWLADPCRDWSMLHWDVKHNEWFRWWRRHKGTE